MNPIIGTSKNKIFLKIKHVFPKMTYYYNASRCLTFFLLSTVFYLIFFTHNTT